MQIQYSTTAVMLKGVDVSSEPIRRDTLSVMTWLTWSLLSALFAAATAILAKVGIAGIDANLATAVRTSVVVIFTWLLAYATRKPEGLQA